MVKEQLTLHQVEGEVMKSPAEDRSANLVVESLESRAGVVVVAALPSENSNALEDDPDRNGNAGRPPDNGVSEEVDLSVLASPEVDTSAEDGPRLRARVPGMGVSEASVGPPHDLVKLPELAKEARSSVVDLLNIALQLRVSVALDVPQAVRESTTASASHLLLLGSPIGELDLVGEENTASHDMDETELGLNGSEAGLGESTLGLLLDNLDTEEIVGITIETLIAIGRDLVLPVGLGDRGTDIVGVKAAMGRAVVESENSTVLDVLWLGKSVPGIGTVDRLAIDTEGLSLVLQEPDVVVVLVRIQSDLLLLAAGRVHERVRVKVTALGVNVTDGDTAAHDDIGGDVLHSLVVEGSLELGAHETISVTGVLEGDEVDGEHGHIEGQRDDDQGKDTSHEVLSPKTLEEVSRLFKNQHE